MNKTDYADLIASVPSSSIVQQIVFRRLGHNDLNESLLSRKTKKFELGESLRYYANVLKYGEADVSAESSSAFIH